MKVSGEFTVNAPRERVFETIRDPRRLVSFVDGVHDLKELDPTHHEAMFETKIAYLRFKFAITSRSSASRRRAKSKRKSRASRSGLSAASSPNRRQSSPTSAARRQSPIPSTPLSLVSSAASGSRCCEPRPRKWNGNSQPGCVQSLDPPWTSWSYDPV
jgi:Carbon monoxide dehydrogenase subunit G (CoxG)